MRKVIWERESAMSRVARPDQALQESPRDPDTGKGNRWLERWATRWHSAWEKRVRTGQFMSHLRSLALTAEDLAWLPRLVNIRLLIVSDQALLDSRARQPALILLPTGESWPVDTGGASTPIRQPEAQTFYRLFLLSVRSLPLAPEACLLREQDRWAAWDRSERERGVVVARTGAVLSPRHQGLMVSEHALLDRASGGGRRATFSLVRGAPDLVLAHCRWLWQPGSTSSACGESGDVRSGGRIHPLTGEQVDGILAAAGELMARGLLPVALAIRHRAGVVLGSGHPRGLAPLAGGRPWPTTEAAGGGKAAVYMGLMAFDNPLLAGVQGSLEFFRSRGVTVLWESRLPLPLQQAIAVSSLSGLVITGEPPSRLGGGHPLIYAGRSPTESVGVCREWEAVRVQAFPDGSGRLQPLRSGDLGHYPGRIVAVPAPTSAESLLVRLQKLHQLAEQAIITGVKSN